MRPRRAIHVILVLVISITVFIIALQRVHSYPPIMKQRAQFYSVEAALEIFRLEFDESPPSDALDPEGVPYGGSQKLLEALMGQDLRGFHPNSRFTEDGTDAHGMKLYFPPAQDVENLKNRAGRYLEPDKVACFKLTDIYGQEKLDSLSGENGVICDVYKHRHANRKKGGMPVLYYCAHTDRSAHDCNDPDNPDNIYDYRDNHALLGLGVPDDGKAVHPLYADPNLFYRMTRNQETGQPVRRDSYLLWSAGYDGLYGTRDDITNFELP